MSKTKTAHDELPAPSRQGGDRKGVWGKRFAEFPFAENKGKWFRVYKSDDPDQAANHARNINHGRVVLPDGEWEASARTDDAGESWVWVRLLG